MSRSRSAFVHVVRSKLEEVQLVGVKTPTNCGHRKDGGVLNPFAS